MNSISDRPHLLLNEEQLQRIRSYALFAENAGQLTPEQLLLIYNNNWFNLFVPAYIRRIRNEFTGCRPFAGKVGLGRRQFWRGRLPCARGQTGLQDF